MHGGEHGAMDGVGMDGADGVDDAHSGNGGGGEHEAGAVARYHRVLTLLPRAYREERGEEMLGVMLDAAQDAGRDRPTPAELLSVLGLSLRLRTGAPGASARARSVGELLRLVTLLGLLLQVATFAQGLAIGVSDATLDGEPLPGLGRLTSGLVALAVCEILCPILALAALLHGRHRLGVLLAANAGVFVPAISGVFAADSWTSAWSGNVVSVLALCTTTGIAGLFGFRRDAPQVARPRLWVVAMIVLGVVFLAVDYANDRPIGSIWAMSSNVFALGCACLAVGVAVSRARRSAVWPVALMVAGVPLLFMLPITMTVLSYSAGVPLLSMLTTPGSMYLFVGLYALGAEVLLTLTVLAALLRQLRSSSAGRQGQRLPHKQ